MLLKCLCTSYRKYATIADILGRDFRRPPRPAVTISPLPLPAFIQLTQIRARLNSVHIILRSEARALDDRRSLPVSVHGAFGLKLFSHLCSH